MADSEWGYASQAISDPAPSGIDPTGLSMADQEMAWLKQQTGQTGTLADLRQLFYGRQKPYLPNPPLTADDVEMGVLRADSVNPNGKSRADLRREYRS